MEVVMSYLGRSAKLSLKAQEKVSFLATAGQTVKTGLSYTPSFIEVYVNGVLLTDTTDFTATNGNSITFTVALLLNDEVTVISLKTFTVADHYTKSDADTLLAAKAKLTKSTTAPSSPAAGDQWFDTTSGVNAMKVYDGTAWKFMSDPPFSATGGTITTSGGYKIHTFTSSGTFTTNIAGTVEYLIVAAGGGGGTYGGGGAGGFLTATGSSVGSGAQAVTVGAGGAGSGQAGIKGSNGSDSSFNSIVSLGGGGGSGSGGNASGLVGGSGGGGGTDSSTLTGGAGTSGQGNTGGTGVNNHPSYSGGGGGGANAVGGNSSGTTGGAGGAGLASSISGSSVTYAGGGGGSGYAWPNAGTGGSGGSGGGGTGSAYVANNSTGGSANTGGGGGGNGNNLSVSSGGSGIVIVRYAV
jgi:hypothetical protein